MRSIAFAFALGATFVRSIEYEIGGSKTESTPGITGSGTGRIYVCASAISYGALRGSSSLTGSIIGP